MADPAAETPPALPSTTRWALERTRVAYERTLMAWARTGTAFITFGFSVYKFFQKEIAGTVIEPGLIEQTLVGPREFGVVLIVIGLLSVLLGSFEHARDLYRLRDEYPGMPKSGTQLIAMFIAILGGLALAAVIYRF
jgi:putative membrane protein